MTSLQDDLDAIDRHTQALLATASRLRTEDLHHPSRCDGWSRGHVLAHLSRNAEAIGNLVHWATSGERTDMYPGGPEGRDADIEAGAGRPAPVQLEDLRATATALAERLPDLAHPVVETVEARGGFAVKVGDLPGMRLREVVFHHVDLDAGFGFEEVEGDLLRVFVEDAIGRLRRSRRAPSLRLRTDEGDVFSIGDGDHHVSGPRSAVLLWLARRDASGVTGDPPELPQGA